MIVIITVMFVLVLSICSYWVILVMWVSDRWFKPPLRRYVVSLNKTLSALLQSARLTNEYEAGTPS